MKRLIDLFFGATLLLVLAPLLILCALAVRFSSSGPTLFRQRRLGLHGTPFVLLKFRTMLNGAPELRNEDGSSYTLSADYRLTGAGRVLRDTSLDELPQLINILRGEMSLVGPRPDQSDQLQFYTHAERRKLEVKPGLTGLAQISGRNAIPWKKRKELDLLYVDRQSLRLDFWILIKTIPYVLKRRNVFNA